MKNMVESVGAPNRIPKAGDNIQYLKDDGTWCSAQITSKYSKSSGWMNVKEDDGHKRSVDLSSGAWKYDVIIAEIVHETFVTFIPPDEWGNEECLQAKRKELAMWEKFGVVKEVPDNEQYQKIKTKWILVEKEDTVNPTKRKVKARLVVLGNMETTLPSIQTHSDSPLYS